MTALVSGLSHGIGRVYACHPGDMVPPHAILRYMCWCAMTPAYTPHFHMDTRTCQTLKHCAHIRSSRPLPML